jgi:primosomal protein N' (replication factor Y)
VIARVQPLTRTRAVRGLFDYRLAGDHAGVGVGSILRIPFGNAKTVGVVVELAESSELPAERLAEPEGVIEPGVTPELVALARWMSHEYCSTWARALTLVLAPGLLAGVRAKLGLVAELTESGRLAVLEDGALTERQRHLLHGLDRLGPTPTVQLGTPALRRLEARGLVAIEPRPLPRRPLQHNIASAASVAPALTDEQREALTPVLAAIDGEEEAGRDRSFLLHGVTGAGKTEVYLQAVQAVLDHGRDAIVLVPEISLTPQVTQRFAARFAGSVAVMHSGMGPGERFDEWQRLAGGEARVCVGPRSAIFAPLHDVGLIVVDEEHESSYKHEGDPRYDARTVAERRARMNEAVLLVGSATPRPESAHRLRRLRLRSRIDGRPLPPVEILDMRGHHHPLHPLCRLALSDLRRQQGKGIVLLNRRGWSNFLSCRSCGKVWMCPDCDVALVLHRRDELLACHHCGHRERLPSCCPACASVALARHGTGTERIERELAEGLAGEAFEVLRLDADLAGPSRAETLERFAEARAGLLVGTQMVAKGHDFPDVRLAIVLDADGTLRFPDFRAEERTFALITQLAGRAGRGGRGRVLVQTIAPDARAIELAARHDVDGFLHEELDRRSALDYPPFAALIRIVCAAAAPEQAARTASRLREQLHLDDAAILGPAPLFRLRGRTRSQIVVKAHDRQAAIGAVGRAVTSISAGASGSAVSVSVDVDPQ